MNDLYESEQLTMTLSNELLREIENVDITAAKVLTGDEHYLVDLHTAAVRIVELTAPAILKLVK